MRFMHSLYSHISKYEVVVHVYWHHNVDMSCSGAAHVHCCAAFGEGSGPILLDDLDCNGGVGGLEECSHGAWGEHDCHHSEDVGLTCLSQNLEGNNGQCNYALN